MLTLEPFPLPGELLWAEVVFYLFYFSKVGTKPIHSKLSIVTYETVSKLRNTFFRWSSCQGLLYFHFWEHRGSLNGHLEKSSDPPASITLG